eukprot:g28206.t1
MNLEIHSLLKSTSEAYRLGNPDLYRKFRYNLCKAIRDAKRQYQTKLETQTNHTDTHRSSTAVTIFLALHSSLEQQDNIDYSSTYNTIIPNKFISKLRDQGTNRFKNSFFSIVIRPYTFPVTVTLYSALCSATLMHFV